MENKGFSAICSYMLGCRTKIDDRNDFSYKEDRPLHEADHTDYRGR